MAGPDKIPVTTTRIPVKEGDELVCECFPENSSEAQKAAEVPGCTEALGREGKRFLNSIEGKKATCVCALISKPLHPIKALGDNQMKAISQRIFEAIRSTLLEPMKEGPQKGLGGEGESSKIVRDAFSVSTTDVAQEAGIVEASFRLMGRDDYVSPDDIIKATKVFHAKFEDHLKPGIIKQLKSMGITNPKVSVAYLDGGRSVSIKIGR